jgi:hypothetical protein
MTGLALGPGKDPANDARAIVEYPSERRRAKRGVLIEVLRA